MKLLFINEGIFEPYKSFVERDKSSFFFFLKRLIICIYYNLEMRIFIFQTNKNDKLYR